MNSEKNKYNNSWAGGNSNLDVHDTEPLFLEGGLKDWVQLLFYPKKFLFYLYLKKEWTKGDKKNRHNPFRILQINCGSGSSLVDIKKIFGREVEIYGVDSTKLQIDVAEKRIKKHEVYVKLDWWNGKRLDFPTKYFDVIFSFDDSFVPILDDVNRVLKPKGKLVLFSQNRDNLDKLISSGFRKLNSFSTNLYSKKEKFSSWFQLLVLFEMLTIGKIKDFRNELIVLNKNRDSYGDADKTP